MSPAVSVTHPPFFFFFFFFLFAGTEDLLWYFPVSEYPAVAEALHSLQFHCDPIPKEVLGVFRGGCKGEGGGGGENVSMEGRYSFPVGFGLCPLCSGM